MESNFGLYCLPRTFLWDARLYWVSLKIRKIKTPEKIAVIILKFNKYYLNIHSITFMSKRCRWNGKQCWPWSDYYRKFPKYLDTQNICCNHSKIWTMWLYHRVMSPNDEEGMANSVDPDQTAPLGAVWSGSALFAQAYLSENLGSLWYFSNSLMRVYTLPRPGSPKTYDYYGNCPLFISG